MIQALKVLILATLSTITVILPALHQVDAQSTTAVSTAPLSGNMTSPEIAEVVGNTTALPTENITITGQGNITISGNITVTDSEGNVIPLEEILFSGDIDFGCRRCH